MWTYMGLGIRRQIGMTPKVGVHLVSRSMLYDIPE